jgi:hypothetical protein
MRCKKAKKLISDYIDRELRPSKRTALEEHLETCEECRKIMKHYKTISETAQGFQAEAPSPFLWTRIKQGLETAAPSDKGSPKRAWRWSPQLKYAVSLFTALLVVGAVVIGFYQLGNRSQFRLSDPQKEVIANLKQAEKHYKLAIESMMKAAHSLENGMDPEVAKVFQAHLELIDSSIAACREAVLNDPKDIESRNILLAAYKEKANLLYQLLNVKDYSPENGESQNKI